MKLKKIVDKYHNNSKDLQKNLPIIVRELEQKTFVPLYH